AGGCREDEHDANGFRASAGLAWPSGSRRRQQCRRLCGSIQEGGPRSQRAGDRTPAARGTFKRHRRAVPRLRHRWGCIDRGPVLLCPHRLHPDWPASCHGGRGSWSGPAHRSPSVSKCRSSTRGESHAVKGNPEALLRGFVDKFDPENRRLIRAVRRALRQRFATAFELAYDNYNFFVLGYSPTERPSDAVVSMAAGANGVGLCFIRGATLPDPHKLLLGSGNQTRFIRLESADVLKR